MAKACQYLERYHLAGLNAELEKLYQQVMDVFAETKEYIEKFLANDQ